jgi:hypothetical protein
MHDDASFIAGFADTEIEIRRGDVSRIFCGFRYKQVLGFGGNHGVKISTNFSFGSEFTDIDLNKQKVGIFGQLTKQDAKLEEGTRIEIYRPITADPETIERRDKGN